jgi:hypothetical protein
VLSENKKFRDKTDFWKSSGLDHAWYRLHLQLSKYVYSAGHISLSIVGNYDYALKNGNNLQL